MSMNITELNAETVELLPSREALGRMKFVKIHVNVANVWANNQAQAFNQFSPWADADAHANQYIDIHQS